MSVSGFYYVLSLALQDHGIYSNLFEILFSCNMFVSQYSVLMLLSQKHKTEQT